MTVHVRLWDTTNKFAKKKGKDIGLYKVLGMFNHKDVNLHIYYTGKIRPANDFIVELDLKTCKASFVDQLITDNPEIIETANKYMMKKRGDIGLYQPPEVVERPNEWDVVYREIRPTFDSGLRVIIDKKTRKTTLLGHFGEIPDQRKTEGTLKPSEVVSDTGSVKDSKPAPCNAPGCRGN